MNSRKNTGLTGLLNKYLPGVMVAMLVGGGIAVAALSGCNTVHGAGEDLERGGEKLQNTAERHGAN